MKNPFPRRGIAKTGNILYICFLPLTPFLLRKGVKGEGVVGACDQRQERFRWGALGDLHILGVRVAK
ncbi:MAG: hypothetical protein H6Q42_2089 [Deltaproteobacteria bacterium]|nr:hypothetical protein [Deltaproteobacteria bacterium]